MYEELHSGTTFRGRLRPNFILCTKANWTFCFRWPLCAFVHDASWTGHREIVESYAGGKAFGLGLRRKEAGGAQESQKALKIFKRSKKRHQGKRRYRLKGFEDPLELNDLHFSLFQLSGRRLRREVKGGKKKSKFVKWLICFRRKLR